MMKTSLKWFSALTLMVMCAFFTTACSNDDNNNEEGADNSKIVGTWVVTSVETNAEEGPSEGLEMTFNTNGTFTSGRDSGTYTYNSSTGAFTAQMNSMTMTGTFTVSGDVCSGTVKVTAGGRTNTYKMTMTRKGSSTAEDVEEIKVSSTKMLGTWVVTVDDAEDGNAVGMTIVFKKDGTCTLSGNSHIYTYTCEEDKDGRLKFELFANGNRINSGKLVLVSEGNVLSGEYRVEGQSGDYLRLVMKKPSYSYPTGGILGRWEMTDCSMEGAPVGTVFVFGNAGELYMEGDPHVGSYSYSGNTLSLTLSNGPSITGTLTISGGQATYVGTATMEGLQMSIEATFTKQ